MIVEHPLTTPHLQICTACQSDTYLKFERLASDLTIACSENLSGVEETTTQTQLSATKDQSGSLLTAFERSRCCPLSFTTPAFRDLAAAS